MSLGKVPNAHYDRTIPTYLVPPTLLTSTENEREKQLKEAYKYAIFNFWDTRIYFKMSSVTKVWKQYVEDLFHVTSIRAIFTYGSIQNVPLRKDIDPHFLDKDQKQRVFPNFIGGAEDYVMYGKNFQFNIQNGKIDLIYSSKNFIFEYGKALDKLEFVTAHRDQVIRNSTVASALIKDDFFIIITKVGTIVKWRLSNQELVNIQQTLLIPPFHNHHNISPYVQEIGHIDTHIFIKARNYFFPNTPNGFPRFGDLIFSFNLVNLNLEILYQEINRSFQNNSKMIINRNHAILSFHHKRTQIYKILSGNTSKIFDTPLNLAYIGATDRFIILQDETHHLSIVNSQTGKVVNKIKAEKGFQSFICDQSLILSYASKLLVYPIPFVNKPKTIDLTKLISLYKFEIKDIYFKNEEIVIKYVVEGSNEVQNIVISPPKESTPMIPLAQQPQSPKPSKGFWSSFGQKFLAILDTLILSPIKKMLTFLRKHI